MFEMVETDSILRVLLSVAVGASLLVVGTGLAAACETCADPNADEEDREAFWSNEDVPYDVDENNSLAGVIAKAFVDEIESDVGNATADGVGPDVTASGGVSTSGGNGTASGAVAADVGGVEATASADANGDGNAALVSLGA